MSSSLLADVATLIALLVCSGFFSSAETAVFSMNPIQLHRMRRTHSVAAARLEKLLSPSTRLLSTILIGNTLVNVTAAGIGYVMAEQFFHPYGEVVAIPVMTLLLLVFGEVAPKRLGMANPERMAAAYSWTLTLLVTLTTPLRAALDALTVPLEKHIRRRTRVLTEDEFLTVVEVGEEEGVLDEEERSMVDGIVRLEEMQASDVMTPRVDIVGIDLEDSLQEARETARTARFRYLPLYHESLDTPEGFLDVPRFLLSDSRDVKDAMVPPVFVPETIPLDTLLSTFQKEHQRIAFVTDEYGGTAGLVTRGDILEEIAPDVEGELGGAVPAIQQVEPDKWLVNGNTSLEHLNRELDLDLESEGATRMAGWVAGQAERIPRTGDSVEDQGCRATVQRLRHNRILLVLLERLPPPAPVEEP